MANVVVVGMQWGDEAKGKVVDYLAQGADYVVRYNGGNNAGHTVVIGDEVYKFHTVPVGVLNEGVTGVIADGVVLDPKVFVEEIRGLRDRGIGAEKIKISGNAHVIMPYHRLLDLLEESSKGDKKIGTTGRGIGPCYADKASRTGIRIVELIDPDRFRERLSDCVRSKNKLISVYDGEQINEREVYDEYCSHARVIAPFVADTSALLYEASRECADIVFEGAHASLLDIDYGTYPFVTSSHCVAGGACIGTGVAPTMIDRVIGVAKSYTTRVGAGPCPTEMRDETGDRIREQGNEYGTTTGRPRRCGWFDAVAVRYSARINGVACIALSLLDVLSGFDTLKICTAYDIEGRRVHDFPSAAAVLAKAIPIYEEMPGWDEDISQVRSFHDLPASARRYVERIAHLIEAPICMVSVGRRRDQSIILDAEMLRM
ncbi:MAG: adenylosuccinate synthase [Armatimonadetes bacterium RBG_16_58_9]|nr:MAG: adenylosuccinate synthase [Armatimonadetes bacterium RBG_16_58_9]